MARAKLNEVNEAVEDADTPEGTEAVKGTEPEIAEKNPISEAVENAFKAACEAKKDEDTIKIEMISAGAKFKKVTKMFNELMVKHGYAVSKEDKSKAVAAACVDVELSTEDGFSAATKALIATLEGTSEKSASASIRAYAKKNDLEFFKKPKAEGKGKGGINAKILAAVIDNPKMTEVEMNAFIDEHGSDTTKKTWRSYHQNVRAAANAIAAKYEDTGAKDAG